MRSTMCYHGVLVLVVALLSACCVRAVPCQVHSAVQAGGGQWRVSPGRAEGALAWGCFEDAINTTGWAQLSIETASYASDQQQAMAAGYLEGWLTHDRVRDNVDTFNIIEAEFGKMDPQLLAKIRAWESSWTQWVEYEIALKRSSSVHWYNVDLVFQQLRGLLWGFNNATTGPSITWARLISLNSGADSLDLMAAFSGMGLAEYEAMQPAEVWAGQMRGLGTHCSAFIKWLPEQQDIVPGHTTWDEYSGMLPIYKRFKFHFSPTAAQGSSSVSFSSYPGFMASGDDWYQLGADMVVLETTLSVFNTSLYGSMTPQDKLLTWVRVVVANRMATDASTWVDTFAQYNSGTNNNAWMVVDYGSLAKGKQDNLLWLAEQMPGLVQRADLTELLLSQGYFYSANVPYFADIWHMAGYGAMNQAHPGIYNYTTSPRARIFQRNDSMIHDMQGVQDILRYNNYKDDPLSLGNPVYAPASRYDLASDPQQRAAVGGTDTKVTNRQLFAQQACHAMSGPTHAQQPVFTWSTSGLGDPHIGQPDTWDFQWLLMKPLPL